MKKNQGVSKINLHSSNDKFKRHRC